jgi:hypothetical protein
MGPSGAFNSLSTMVRVVVVPMVMPPRAWPEGA